MYAVVDIIDERLNVRVQSMCFVPTVGIEYQLYQPAAIWGLI